MFQIIEEEVLSSYNHHREEEWDVWEKSRSLHSEFPKNLSNVDHYKIANFFVKHLHSSYQDKRFVFRDIPFLYIHLSGCVVSKCIHKEKLSLEVNDGSGTITCLIEDNMLNDIKEQKTKCNSADNINISSTDTKIHQATLLNIQAMQYLMKSIPCTDDLRTGNIVALLGKLTEYNGKKYIFVTKISCISVEEHMKRLQYCLSFYNEYMSKTEKFI